MLRRTKKRSVQESSEKTLVKHSRIKCKTSDRDSKLKTSKIPILGVTEASLEDAEEERLAKVVLGGDQNVVKTILAQVQDQDQSDSSPEDEHEDLPGHIGVLDREKKKPAWQDEDDDHLNLSKETKGHHAAVWKTNDTELKGSDLKKRLQSQFEKTVGSAPSWATLKSERNKIKGRKSDGDSNSDDEEEDEDEDQFLRRTGDYLTTSQQLPKNNINYQRVTNANLERPTQGRISSVQFHPTSQVLLAAGLDNNLNLFQIDGKVNPMIQTVHMERFPIMSAQFSGDGTEVVMTSRYKHFFVYNMIAGNIARIPNIKGTTEHRLMKFEVSPDGRFLAFIGSYGYIYLLSGKNKELIDTFKMNGNVKAVTFTPDGTQMLSFGDDGDVYVWSLSTRDCVHKFVDNGCLKGTTISVSRNNQYIACGCESGIVNIYDHTCLSHTNPKPLKSVMNLVTPVTSIRFNHTNELVAVSSNFTQNACKLVHLPSYRAFPNFPEFNMRIGCPDSVDISPHSGYLTVGSSRGDALLYRLKHFTDY